MNDSRQPMPAALYARVSSDRQDVDLSVAAQLRALRDFAERNGYMVAREYIDEAESGRVADRPQFTKMLDEAAQPNAPFQEILVWKFSRFTRKREHAVAFKSMLRRRGIRVTSITEHADDTPTGKLMEAIIESVDEFYSENLAQEVTRGMREAAARGFFLGSRAPYGYKRVKVQDGGKERPTLEIDPATAPIVKEMFERSARGQGLKEICQDLHERGITKNSKRWQKNMLHYVLTNEAYTGTAVWGKTAKDGQTPDPVRVADAWPAVVSRELYDAVQAGLRARAPKIQAPARVGSRFLLSGLLCCGVCGKPYTGQSAKSGQFAYYVCNKLLREGAGACDGRYLNAARMEDQVVGKIMQRILNEETITELVQLVAEEVDALAEERASDLAIVESDLDGVRRRLEKLYDAIENSDLTYEALSPRILKLRQQEDQLAAARDDAARQLEQRRADLPSTPEIKRYVAEFREFIEAGTIPERKALIRNFVQGVNVDGDEVSIRYTIPMPSDGATHDRESVLDFVQSGPPDFPKARTFEFTVPVEPLRQAQWTEQASVSRGVGTVAGRLRVRDWRRACFGRD
ncbi:MAG: recombinase family protein [Chloroflexi bacterium]|nr:recombinase family protein [Chloroflexota bacterium]MYD16533.1 recombinase family protein [Chloroflexota bacterium]